MPHVHINSLIFLPKSSHPELPLNARTLLSTPKKEKKKKKKKKEAAVETMEVADAEPVAVPEKERVLEQEGRSQTPPLPTLRFPPTGRGRGR